MKKKNTIIATEGYEYYEIPLGGIADSAHFYITVNKHSNGRQYHQSYFSLWNDAYCQQVTQERRNNRIDEILKD